MRSFCKQLVFGSFILSKFLCAEVSFYDKCFSKSDQIIYSQYLDQGVSIYSTGMANSVLRTRFRAWVDEVAATSEGFQTFKKAEQAVQALNSMEVHKENKTSPSHEAATTVEEKWVFGYDIFSDSTHIEYQKGAFRAGLYHSALFGSIMNSLSFLDLLTLRMTTELGPELPVAFFSYRWNSYVFVTGISQKLSSIVATEISTSQPFLGSANPSVYQIKFVFNF